MNTTNNLEILNTLKGAKATIFKYSEMGFPNSILCEIKDVCRKNYAQYTDVIHVIYRPKNKRTDYVLRLFDYQKFAIFAGHVNLESEMFVSTEKKEDCTLRKSLLAFSDEYLTRALNSTNQKALLIQN